MGDIRDALMADDPDTIWMTYDEAGAALGIKSDSVRRRAASRKWPRRQGNDKLARVGIPRSIIPDRTPAITPAIIPDDPDTYGHVREELAAAKSEISGLQARLTDAQAIIEDLKGDRDAWREQAQRLALETRPAGLLARLFRR